jgi:hypothetical protein
MKLGSRKLDKGWTAFIVLLIALVVGILLLVFQWDSLLSQLCAPALVKERADCEKRVETIYVEKQPEEKKEPEEKAPTPPPEETELPELSEAELKWVEATGTFPKWPADFASPRDCKAVREDLLVLCREIDSRPYMQSREFPQGTFGLVKEICEALAANPPVASGEILRYESMTANVFHIFRTLGKNRTYMLIEILAREQDLAEPMAMAVFRWLLSDEGCGEERAPMSFQVLYDYAAYFLNTLGGHAYIHRRSPKITALTSLYALIVVDRAIRRDFNPHGVDPRPHMLRCRELMKLQDVVFREQYLEVIKEMESRW